MVAQHRVMVTTPLISSFPALMKQEKVTVTHDVIPQYCLFRDTGGFDIYDHICIWDKCAIHVLVKNYENRALF